MELLIWRRRQAGYYTATAAGSHTEFAARICRTESGWRYDTTVFGRLLDSGTGDDLASLQSLVERIYGTVESGARGNR